MELEFEIMGSKKDSIFIIFIQCSSSFNIKFESELAFSMT